MRAIRPMLALALTLSLASAALAVPTVGRPMPRFVVDDIAGNRHTERDLRGQWTVAMVMTDKDVADDFRAWFQRLHPALPPAVRLYSFVAVNIFPLVPTATLISQARGSSPRERWNTVWLSRDGSFAQALGYPEEEMPWILVIDPQGHVALSLHERVSDAGVNRILATVPTEPPAPPAPAEPPPPSAPAPSAPAPANP